VAETFLYSVRSTFTNAAVRAEFIAWLRDGHLADVVEAGALDAELVEFEAEAGAENGAIGDVETRYHFASRAAFEKYANGPAVPLRAEGAARFPPSRGIVMTRGFAVSRLRLPH
jgi:hypothetical protein